MQDDSDEKKKRAKGIVMLSLPCTQVTHIPFPSNKYFFSSHLSFVDYLFKEGSDRPRRKDKYVVRTESLFKVVIDGFAEIWPPSRTTVGDVSLGDVWPCDALKTSSTPADSTDHFVVFHKLSQWMTYSIMEPLETMLNIEWEHANLLTGLPEYRNGNVCYSFLLSFLIAYEIYFSHNETLPILTNTGSFASTLPLIGGLLIDLGFMTLKPKEEERGLVNYKHNALKPGQPAVEVVPTFEPSDPVIIEWRAMTVATLDRIAVEVRKQLNLPNLTLAQVLQGGTWNVSSHSLFSPISLFFVVFVCFVTRLCSCRRRSIISAKLTWPSH